MSLQEELKLIEESKKNPACFEPLYNYYFEKIYRYVYNQVRDKSACGDVTSQVFVKALTNLKKYEYQGFRFSSWLFKIAVNEVKYFIRKNNRTRHVTIDVNAMNKIQDEIEESSKEELFDTLELVLNTLEEEAVRLIEMRFFEGKSFKEISYIMDITENNAKVRIYRLLGRLRKAMQNEEVYNS